jgi:hypothetical protein
MTTGIIVLLVLLLLFNLAITIGVVRDYSLTPLQRVAQVVMIWVLPGIGGFTAPIFPGAHHSRSELRTLLPFPLYYAGAEAATRSPFEHTSYDNTDHDVSDIGDASCGGD